jgi:pimeloyl-ACP methyl ester carboxylesterase
MIHRSLARSSLVVLALVWGCSGAGSTRATQKYGPEIGSLCRLDTDCRSGLHCDAKTMTCAPSGTSVEGVVCVQSDECVPGLYCAQKGTSSQCVRAGTGVVGTACTDTSQCQSGLTCDLQGLTGSCVQAGAGKANSVCAKTPDCMAGMVCLGGICQTTTPTGPWTGGKCDSAVAATPTILFHVPRTGEPESTDFYRLPFPIDIRRQNGHINMKGHPRPGAGLVGVDLVDRYITAIEQDSTGFGANQAIFFRLSREPDMKSFVDASGNIALINITPTSPEYGWEYGLGWTLNGGRTPYICDRYMVIRPSLGNPLRPGDTYAAILKRLGRDNTGTPFGPDPDFTAMLSDTSPSDPDLAAAWTTYAPFRAFLADGAKAKVKAAELSVAAVFTVEKYEAPLAAIQAAIAAAPAPGVSKLVRCNDAGAVSPCEDGLPIAAHVRGCFPGELAGASFDEYQGVITLPVFQQGTPPYANDGGGITLGSDGSVPIVRNEDVCFSLTVPHGTAPAAGWPLLVYAHGTGGSFRSAVDLGLAEDYAKGAAPMAVLGYEGVLHGTRKGNSTKSTDELVYNFLNPRAARDNALQAAADLLAIPRALPGLAAQTAAFDLAHVSLYGHSQGGNAAALALATSPDFGAGVMSGTGGTLLITLLQKEHPVSVKNLLPVLLSEPSVDEDDPVVNLVQMYFERSDTVNFGRRLFREPNPGVPARHVLHIYGTKDSYAPVETQRRYAQAGRLSVATPFVDDYPIKYDMQGLPGPITANQAFGTLGTSITAAQIQYAPIGSDDGHFVSTNVPAARAALQRFLTTFITDSAPTISP